MLALEREAAPAIAAALAKLERDLFRGVAEDDAETELLRRLDDPETAQALRDTLMTHLQAAALAGAGFGREQIEREVFGVKGIFGIDWDLANNAAAQWALNFVGNLIGVGDLVAPGAPESLIKQIMDTTRDRVRREVSEFVTNSETMTDLRRRLESVFSPQRAEMIAATEVTRAFAEGNMASWREAGVVERRRWNTANDEIVCPICGPLHNMVVALGESFDGIASPPAHPRCRCWITPEVEG